METKCHPCAVMVLISFSTSWPSPAQVTALYSPDDDDDVDDVGDDDDDERLNNAQPETANATAHATIALMNLLVIASYTHSQ